MDTNKLPRLIKADEAAEILQLTRRTIYDLVQKRKIPFYRYDGGIRFDVEDLKEYLEKRRVKAFER